MQPFIAIRLRMASLLPMVVKTITKMIAILLLLAIIICCRLFSKTIDWFEKI